MTMLLSLLFALPSFASTQSQEAQSCQNRVERGGSIQVQMTASASGACYVSVGNYKRNMVYRSFLFADDGNFMIFNSYGNGPISESTAAREFYTFPRRFKNPTFKWNEELRRLEVTSSAGDEYYFDYETAEISGINTAEVQVATDVVPTNNGGVEIKKYKGLMLDAGFKMGQAPTQSPNNKAKFIDEAGKTCDVKVGDVFTYTSDGDPQVKYSDKNLAVFLKKKCPKLKFPALAR